MWGSLMTNFQHRNLGREICSTAREADEQNGRKKLSLWFFEHPVYPLLCSLR